MNVQYLYPIFAMVGLVTLVGGLLLFRRVRAIRQGKVQVRRFKTLSDNNAPSDLLQAERQFINIFELPVLFYPALIVSMVLPLQSSWGLWLAWLFVLLRVLQAIIHLWFNVVLVRMSIFLMGFMVLLSYWVLILLQLIGR